RRLRAAATPRSRREGRTPDRGTKTRVFAPHREDGPGRAWGDGHVGTFTLDLRSWRHRDRRVLLADLQRQDVLDGRRLRVARLRDCRLAGRLRLPAIGFDPHRDERADLRSEPGAR